MAAVSDAKISRWDGSCDGAFKTRAVGGWMPEHSPAQFDAVALICVKYFGA
jgi:hypothetical protein